MVKPIPFLRHLSCGTDRSLCWGERTCAASCDHGHHAIDAEEGGGIEIGLGGSHGRNGSLDEMVSVCNPDSDALKSGLRLDGGKGRLLVQRHAMQRHLSIYKPGKKEQSRNL